MKNDRIQVVIADDHKLIVDALEMVLQKAGLEVAGTASTGRQAIELTIELEPDVLLLDLRLPDMDGFHILATIKSVLPDTAVIVLTSYPESEYLIRAIIQGAAGFLTKDCAPEQIPNAILGVMSGDTIVDLELLQAAFEDLGQTTQAYHAVSRFNLPTMTQQETRILALIAEGLNNQTIAAELSLSPNTVKSHARSIFRKLGVTDRTQAVIWAFRRGLVAGVGSQTRYISR
jgi:DNA-binding NarL/FixJ family response regulator